MVLTDAAVSCPSHWQSPDRSGLRHRAGCHRPPATTAAARGAQGNLLFAKNMLQLMADLFNVQRLQVELQAAG